MDVGSHFGRAVGEGQLSELLRLIRGEAIRYLFNFLELTQQIPRTLLRSPLLLCNSIQSFIYLICKSCFGILPHYSAPPILGLFPVAVFIIDFKKGVHRLRHQVTLRVVPDDIKEIGLCAVGHVHRKKEKVTHTVFCTDQLLAVGFLFIRISGNLT